MWMVLAWDRPGPEAATERQRLLAAHLAHVEETMDRLLVAGPLTDAEGAVRGSLLILDVADEPAARAFMAHDPYSGGAIWATVEYRQFRGVAGKWVGGAAWKAAKPSA